VQCAASGVRAAAPCAVRGARANNELDSGPPNFLDMPLPSRPLGLPFGAVVPKVLIECYVDFCCPFSKKIYDTLTCTVLPHFNRAAAGDAVLRVVFHQVRACSVATPVAWPCQTRSARLVGSAAVAPAVYHDA
jgi:hypothetical protein